MRGERLAAAALGHQEAIRVGKIRVEHRERDQLPEGRLEQNERAPARASPRHLDRHEIGNIRRKHVLIPLVRLGHTRQCAEKDSPLGDRLRHGLRAIHVGEGVQHLLRPVGEFALGPFEIAKRDRRLRGPDHDRKAQLGRFERRRDDVSLHLDQLRLRHFCFGIGFEVPVRILLRGRHLLEALLIALEHLYLIGNHDLSADDDGETESREVLQHPRKGRIRKFLEAHNRVEIPIDIQVSLGLIEDARLGRLLPRAAVLDHLLSRHILPPIAPRLGAARASVPRRVPG